VRPWRRRAPRLDGSLSNSGQPARSVRESSEYRVGIPSQSTVGRTAPRFPPRRDWTHGFGRGRSLLLGASLGLLEANADTRSPNQFSTSHENDTVRLRERAGHEHVAASPAIRLGSKPRAQRTWRPRQPGPGVVRDPRERAAKAVRAKCLDGPSAGPCERGLRAVGGDFPHASRRVESAAPTPWMRPAAHVMRPHA
jgi:hypothetical protein